MREGSLQKFVTHSESETVAKGVELARRLKPGDVVALYGELGTGKTHLIQGICHALGVRAHVASPTFTIVNEYSAGERRIYHFDFYRVETIREILDVGFEEYINSQGISLIEWAEKVQSLLPPHHYDIRMEWGDDENSRTISIDEAGESVS